MLSVYTTDLCTGFLNRIEPALPERQSGVLTAILWNPLCMRTGGTGPQDCFYICLLTVLNLYCIYSDNLIYRYVEHCS